MEAILQETSHSQGGTGVSHLQTLVKDLHKTSLPLPLGCYRLQKGREKPLPTETRLLQRADDKRKQAP